MDRSELYMKETYKCEELKKKLKPITNWKNIKQGTQIFHEQDNNIYNTNIFISYDKENNLVKYIAVSHQKENKEYAMSANGWYIYDESIVDEVEELYTPKLYIINSIKYPEDIWFTVAFNEQHLIECFKKEMNEKNLTDEEFQDKYNWEQLKNVDGFKIVLE